MSAIEVWNGSLRARVVELVDATYLIGSDEESADLLLEDRTVSGLHARLDRIGATWLLIDLGSRNGTAVNGERLTGQRRIRSGEEIHLGQTRLVFRDGIRNRPITAALASPPRNLTKGERQVLIELCRPILTHNAFQPPASVREISERMYVGRNAVQNHLANLYDKFGIHGDASTNRRVELANAAMLCGAVTLGDLEPPDHRTDGTRHG